MRNELRKAVDEYVDESAHLDLETDIFDLLEYINALELEFDEESELNELESYYYSIA